MQWVKEHGRPEDESGRLEKEIKVYDYLNSLNISFDRVDHEEAVGEEICERVGKVLGAKVCKNLFLCNAKKTEFYMLMLPLDKRFKTKELPKQISCSRLSFASPEYMLEFLDTTPGSVSVLGLMNDTEKRIQLLIDQDLLKEEYVGWHPLINTSTLALKVSDVLDVFLPSLDRTYQTVDLLGADGAIVKAIWEEDYGCEERSETSEVMSQLVLETVDGEQIFHVKDQALLDHNVVEGMRIKNYQELIEQLN